MSKALITMYHGDHEAFRSLTSPALHHFALRHGYDIYEADVDPRHNAAWSKLPALTTAMQHSDVALWVDADVLILDDSQDPAVHLSDETFLVILDDMRYGVCSALFALRSCPTSRRFVNEAWAMRCVGYPDWDQGAIHDLIAGDMRPEYARGAKRLGHDWYGPEGCNPHGRILHGCRQTAPTVAERAVRLRRRAERRGAVLPVG